MVVVMIGVAGSGKSTVGRSLAQRLGWEFLDGDDLHPVANRSKMRVGIALTDADREPWLAAIRLAIVRFIADAKSAVVACSGLKQRYRDLLSADSSQVKFVFLTGDRAVIAQRLADRRGHFFDKELLQSQFEALEEPVGAIVEDVARDPATIVDSIRAKLGI